MMRSISLYRIEVLGVREAEDNGRPFSKARLWGSHDTGVRGLLNARFCFWVLFHCTI